MSFLRNLRMNSVRLVFVIVACFALLLSAETATFASGTASITLSPAFGPPLALVKISGRGFGGNEPIIITFDSRNVGSANTSSTGTFATKFSVPIDALPNNYAGTHTVLATGQKSGRPAEAPFTVQTNWSMAGFDAHDTKFNPVENVLSSSNVSKLLSGWSFSTAGRYPGSCPIIANGLAYLGSSDGNLYALNAYTGVKKWSIPSGSRYTAASCPAIANNVLYIGTNDGTLSAFKASTGTTMWSVNTLGQIESSPVVANGLVYVSSFDNTLYAFNAKTGARVWGFATTSALTSTPAVANGLVYLGAQDNNLYALNATTGTKVWSFATTGPVGSPAVTNGVVYAGSQDGNLYALNAATGAKVWSFATTRSIGSPAVGNGIVYASSQDGDLYALDASSGSEMWKSAESGVLALANGVIYSAANDGNLYALDAYSGSPLWSHTVGVPENSPTVVNGIVYIVQLSNIQTFNYNIG
jgi:outer membrane protein assembly factor BamB